MVKCNNIACENDGCISYSIAAYLYITVRMSGLPRCWARVKAPVDTWPAWRFRLTRCIVTIAFQATPMMAADEDASGLTRVRLYLSKCNPSLWYTCVFYSWTYQHNHVHSQHNNIFHSCSVHVIFSETVIRQLRDKRNERDSTMCLQWTIMLYINIKCWTLYFQPSCHNGDEVSGEWPLTWSADWCELDSGWSIFVMHTVLLLYINCSAN